MYGAVIGDLAGSIYEYNQLKSVKEIKMGKLIENNAFYSDDTILTIAICDAILNNGDYGEYLKKYINEFINYKPQFSPYFKSPFSPSLIKWGKTDKIGNSIGNGAMMRISPVGYLFNTEEDVIKNAYLATIPSHNSKEAVDAATKIALIIYYLRNGLSKEEIFKKLDIDVRYKPFTKFNVTCNETIDNCLYAFYNSSSFEDAIRRTLFMGGDTDTNCAIVGSMAEALYGINDLLIQKTNERIPKKFVRILSNASYGKIN